MKKEKQSNMIWDKDSRTAIKGEIEKRVKFFETCSNLMQV